MDAALNTNERQGHWCSLFLHPPTLNTPEGDTQSASLCLLQPLTLFTILSDEQSEEQKVKGFSSRLNPVDKKRRKTPTFQRFAIPVLLGDHGRCDILPRWDRASTFLCSTAYELSHHFRSWDCGTVAVWESWSGGGRLGIKGRKRERAETQG